MYRINFNTGAGNVENIETLEKAMEIADSETAYTQQDIDIYEDGNEKPVLTRRWCGTQFDPELFEDGENANVIKFGSFGYYDEWSENY